MKQPRLLVGIAGLLGNAFHHSDIGGYTSLFGNVRSKELLMRWAGGQVLFDLGIMIGAGTNQVRHRVVGDLTLDWTALVCTANPDQQLFTWTAEPGTPSHTALRTLASRPTATSPRRRPPN